MAKLMKENFIVCSNYTYSLHHLEAKSKYHQRSTLTISENEKHVLIYKYKALKYMDHKDCSKASHFVDMNDLNTSKKIASCHVSKEESLLLGLKDNLVYERYLSRDSFNIDNV